MKKVKSSDFNEELTNEFLERIVDALKRIADQLESFKVTSSRDIEYERPKVEVPTEIKYITSEELAEKMLEFAKKEFPNGNVGYIRNLSYSFFLNKNMNRFNFPIEIQSKIDKSERLAEKQLLENEKARLPSLVNSCIIWAKDRGLKKVNKSDVTAFLIENNLGLFYQTKDALYAMVNVSMRSKV